MMTKRIFHSADHMLPAEDEPIRSVVTQSEDATVVAWHVKPGQKIAVHVHPNGQDTWTILSGSGQYRVDTSSSTHTINTGDIAIAHKGQVHGVYNAGSVPLVFISVVCPAEAGYELIK